VTSLGFASLFFGLITGPHPVVLSVTGPVAAVEILVDGERAATVEGPPWTAAVDFGPALAPHEVVLRALDRQGREIDRATEYVNLPRSIARVDLVLEPTGGARPRTARVVWSNLRNEKAVAVTLTLNGAPLELDGERRAVLPHLDPATAHLLAAEVTFASGATLRKDVLYGGRLGTVVATELTAVPLRVPGGARQPTPAELSGRLTAGAQRLVPTAIEKGPAQLLVVRAASPRETWLRLGTRGAHREVQAFEEGDQVRFVFPFARRFRTASEASDLFELSTPLHLARRIERSLRGRLGSVISSLPHEPEPRIADAVAVAGLEAVRQSRRRAVLLLLAGNETDSSKYDPAAVRRFLSAIQVPLFVWYLQAPPPDSALAEWGGLEVTSAHQFRMGAEAIRDELASQRIVLVEGRHLPQAIGLEGPADGFTLAGRATP
jgi:hypothetical protein